jgi:glutaredoxin
MNSDPEQAQPATANALEVTMYTRPGCHLCEDAKAVVLPLLREFGANLREVSIDTDSKLIERYGSDIPVIFVGARKAAKHRVDPKQFRRQLEQARTQTMGKYKQRKTD